MKKLINSLTNSWIDKVLIAYKERQEAKKYLQIKKKHKIRSKKLHKNLRRYNRCKNSSKRKRESVRFKW